MVMLMIYKKVSDSFYCERGVACRGKSFLYIMVSGKCTFNVFSIYVSSF